MNIQNESNEQIPETSFLELKGMIKKISFSLEQDEAPITSSCRTGSLYQGKSFTVIKDIVRCESVAFFQKEI